VQQYVIVDGRLSKEGYREMELELLLARPPSRVYFHFVFTGSLVAMGMRLQLALDTSLLACAGYFIMLAAGKWLLVVDRAGRARQGTIAWLCGIGLLGRWRFLFRS
jgi:hypothetical protein